ncbi:MAG: hypothetical protein KGJ77_03325 [Acidobacteriota bacterium]|nr:hypothetical protein [Acidobacteriota bacterium]
MSVAPEVVDKALAVVVDERRATVAVWRGRSRIELHDLAGTRHDTAVASPLDDQGSWTRAEVLAFAHRALGAVVPIAPGPPAGHPMLQVETADLQRAWLVRARPTGYALWNGADVVDVFDHEGAHRRAVRVPPADLSTLAQLMLDLVALAGRARDVPAATA